MAKYKQALILACRHFGSDCCPEFDDDRIQCDGIKSHEDCEACRIAYFLKKAEEKDSAL